MIIADKQYYGVRVVNGRMDAAGTTGGVDTYITLIGTEGSTGKVSLLGTLRYLFKGMDSGTYEDLVIKTEKNLGDIQVVIIGIEGGLLAFNSVWFVDYTDVSDLTRQSKSVHFPCYHWIKANEYVSTTSKAGEKLSWILGPSWPKMLTNLLGVRGILSSSHQAI